MVLCKFFKEGYCRNGNNCRFEHSQTSKYSYHAPSPVAPTQQTTRVSTEQLLNVVKNDVSTAMYGKQWLLSAYGPFSKKNFPGFQDVSPEEVRLAFYEAKANNAVDSSVATYNNMLQEAKTKFSRLLNPDDSIVKAITSIYKQENVSDPFGSSFGQQQSAQSVFGGQNPSSVFGQSSVFGGQTNTNPQSVFGQANASSVFGGQNTNQSNPTGQSNGVFGGQNSSSFFGGQNSPSPQSVFGSSAPSTAQSVFGGQNTTPQSVFGQNTAQNVFGGSPNPQSAFGGANSNPSNVFGAQNATAQNVFGGQSSPKSFFGAQNSPTPQSVFGSQNTPTGVFGSPTPQSVFGSQNQNVPTQSPFGQTVNAQSPFQSNSTAFNTQQAPNIFGNSAQPDSNFGNSEIQLADDCYSKLDELSQEDLQYYKNDNFEFGFIPELPPPQELCF